MRFEKLIEASNRGHCMLCTTIGINFVVVVLLVRSTYEVWSNNGLCLHVVVPVEAGVLSVTN